MSSTDRIDWIFIDGDQRSDASITES